MIKAAIFDLDETLLDHGSSIRHFAKDQHQRLLGEGSIDSSRFIDVFVDLDAYGLTPRPDLFKELVHRLDLELLPDELLNDFNSNEWKSPVLFEGVTTLLSKLSAKGTRLIS